jgi:hypothetical protein
VNGVTSTQFKILLLLVFLCSGSVYAQKPEFTIKDLVSFTALPVSKFDSYISKKGFKPQGDAGEDIIDNGFLKVSKDKSIHKLLGRYDNSDTSTLFFQTNSLIEFNELKHDLEEDGFIHAAYDSLKTPFPRFYQRANVTIYPSAKSHKGETIYSFKVERKSLPSREDIRFAEDLLQLSSHEYIAAVYGASNVQKDRFYFSETEVNRCSVLFPNTSFQVIFIWKDEVNNKGISFIMIGGQLRSQSSRSYHKAIEMNKWQSKQGIYLGMSLKEMEKLNGDAVHFYGWESDQPGMVSPKNKGSLNFKQLGVQVNCLDCNEDKYYSKLDLINSKDVIQQNGRVFVSMLMLMP